MVTFSEDLAAAIFRIDCSILQHTAAIWDGSCITLRQVDIHIPNRTALCMNRLVQPIQKTLRSKVKLSLSTPWRHIGGSRGIAPFILNLVTRRTWADNITPRPFKPRVRALISTEKEAGWAAEAVWMFGDEKNLAPVRNRIPVRPGCR